MRPRLITAGVLVGGLALLAACGSSGPGVEARQTGDTATTTTAPETTTTTAAPDTTTSATEAPLQTAPAFRLTTQFSRPSPLPNVLSSRTSVS